MSSRAVFALVLAHLTTAWPAAGAPPAAAMNVPSKAEVRITAAQGAQRRGDYSGAMQAYDSTLVQPKDSVAKAVRAKALLGKGRTFEVWGGAARDARAPGDSAAAYQQRARLDSAATYYQLVLESGDKDARATAGISLGVVQLRRGDAPAAVRALRSVDVSRVSSPKRALRDYHLARALVVAGDTASAVKAAENALRNGAADDLVVGEAFGLLLQLQDAKGSSAARLGQILIESNRPTAALANLSPCLDRWGGGKSAIDILGQMLRAHARLGLDSASVGGLVARYASSEALRPALEDVTRAFGGDFAVPGSDADVRLVVPAWFGSRERREAMSEFLQAAALARLRSGSLRTRRTGADSAAALARSVAAFRLDRSNADAALYAGSLLVSGLVRDVQLSDRLIDDLLQGLFVEKGSAYAASDYPQIVRLHYVLAKIFEQRGEIGTSYSGTHSVVFQLEHALEVQERGEKLGVEMPPVPGLHAWLARIYESLDSVSGGGRGRATHQYLLAAREFARASSRTEAEAMLARAGEVPAADAAMLAEVRRALGALSAEAD